MATAVTQRKHTATKHLSQAKEGERVGRGQLQPPPRRGAGRISRSENDVAMPQDETAPLLQLVDDVLRLGRINSHLSRVAIDGRHIK